MSGRNRAQLDLSLSSDVGWLTKTFDCKSDDLTSSRRIVCLSWLILDSAGVSSGIPLGLLPQAVSLGEGGVWVHFPEQHLVYMSSYIEPNIYLHVSSHFFYL